MQFKTQQSANSPVTR